MPAVDIGWEPLLIFGIVLALALRELWALRRSRSTAARDLASARTDQDAGGGRPERSAPGARHPEGQ